MKGLKNEKYTKIFMIALGILAVSLLFLGFLLNFDYFKGIFKAFLSACKPIVYAVLVVFCVNGIISTYNALFMKLFKKSKKKEVISKVLSVALGYITLLVIIAAMMVIVIVPFISSCAKLVDAVPEYIAGAKEWIDQTVKSIPFLSAESDKIIEYINNSFSFSYESISEYAPVVMGIANKIISEASNLLIGFIISIYIVVSSDYIDRIKNRLVHVFLSDEDAARVHEYIHAVYGYFTRYFSGRALYAIIVWIVFYVIMWALGIEFYSVISLVIAVLTFAPVVGVVLAFGMSSFFVLIASYTMAIPFVLIFIAVMVLGKVFLQKKIIHDSVRASVTASLISVLALYGLFGTVGALVAVPLYLSVKRLAREILIARDEKKNRGECSENDTQKTSSDSEAE